MSILRIGALIAALAAVTAGAVEPRDPQLSAADQARFERIVAMFDAWEFDLETLRREDPVMRDLLARYPRSVPVLVESARLDIMHSGEPGEDDARRYASAGAKLHTALSIAPRDLRANVLLGHLRTLEGKLTEARAALKLADTITAEDGWRDVNWGDLELRLGNEDAAGDRYLRAMYGGAADPRNIAAALCHLQSVNDGIERYRKREPLVPVLRKQGMSLGDIVAIVHHVLRSPCSDKPAVLAAQDIMLGVLRLRPPIDQFPVDQWMVTAAETTLRMAERRDDVDHLHVLFEEEGATRVYMGLKEALARDSGNAYATALMAGLMFDGYDHATAESMVRDAERRGLDHPRLRYERARLLQQQGNARDAASLFASLYEDHTDRRTALDGARRWPWALAAAGDLPAAERAFLENIERLYYSRRAEPDYLLYLVSVRADPERAVAWLNQHPWLKKSWYGHEIAAIALYARWAQLVAGGGDTKLAESYRAEAAAIRKDVLEFPDHFGRSKPWLERALGNSSETRPEGR